MSHLSLSHVHRHQTDAARRAEGAAGDYFVIAEMKDVLRGHLNGALLACAALAHDLETIDPDKVMDDLRREFDPTLSAAPIQDCFSDGFHKAFGTLRDHGGEPLAAHRDALPSGAERPVDERPVDERPAVSG